MTLRGAAIAALLLAVPTLSGCRALNLGTLDRPGPSQDPVLDETTREVVDAINANARGVQSLQVKTSISVSMQGRVASAHASGPLMMQRPRDFKLVLRPSRMMGGEVANIGSNSEGFWFWVQNRDDPSIYTCKYDADGKLPPGIPLTMQPDWIIDSLGLREISEDEAKSLKATRGEQPGTLVLRGKRPAGDGQFYITETVVSADSKRVLSHAILAPDRKTVLTRAQLSDFKTVGAEADGASTVLPGRVILSWVREGLTLDVSLNLRDLTLNAALPESQFQEIALQNVPRRDLAAMVNAPAADGPTTIRESRPIPPSGRRPGLFRRDPAPVGSDASTRSTDPKPLDADLPQLPGSPSSESAALITIPLPQPAVDPSTTVTRDARRPAWVGFER